MSSHTIAIFEQVYNSLPPLVPERTKEEMQHALEHLKNDCTITVDDVDDTLIVFGKQIWAYWQAFKEFFHIYEGKLGEKFLLGKLPRELKAHYLQFKEHGGNYKDVYSGSPMPFFSVDERQVLAGALVQVDLDIRAHVIQAVLSTERKKYEDLIINFQTMLDDIEKRLGSLRQVADDEQEHPQLADEIRAQVRAFEFGLCLLGPNTKHEDVINAEVFFQQRKIHKQLHR